MHVYTLHLKARVLAQLEVYTLAIEYTLKTELPNMSVDGSAINNEEGSERGSSRGGSNAAFEQINTNMGKMFEVLQNMGEAFQHMATKQGRHHYDSDLDEPLAKVAKTSVSEPLETSKAHDISHDVSDLFEDTQSVKECDSDADILDDIDDPFNTADKVGPPVRAK